MLNSMQQHSVRWSTHAFAAVALLLGASCAEPVRPNAPVHDAHQVTSLAARRVTPLAAVTIAVRDFSFTPQAATVAQGTTVQWRFSGPSVHTATDNSGMSLFDSGDKPAGSQYSFTFIAAGTYPYVCVPHSSVMRGRISVRLKASPASGTRTTRFTITWASAAPPRSYAFDVQLRRPGSTRFVNWKTAQTARSATFVPDAGVGTYSFRARLRKPDFGRASGYSPTAAISVR
jgi:plastocyanin